MCRKLWEILISCPDTRFWQNWHEGLSIEASLVKGVLTRRNCGSTSEASPLTDATHCASLRLGPSTAGHPPSVFGGVRRNDNWPPAKLPTRDKTNEEALETRQFFPDRRPNLGRYQMVLPDKTIANMKRGEGIPLE